MVDMEASVPEITVGEAVLLRPWIYHVDQSALVTWLRKKKMGRDHIIEAYLSENSYLVQVRMEGFNKPFLSNRISSEYLPPVAFFRIPASDLFGIVETMGW